MSRIIVALQCAVLAVGPATAGCSSSRDRAGEAGSAGSGAGEGAAETARASAESRELAGTWRAVLESPGGELPFGLGIEKRGDAYSGVVINGEERRPVPIERDGDRVTIRLDPYDAVIEAEISRAVGDRPITLRGEWRKTIPGGTSRLPFTATPGRGERFAPAGPPPGTAGDAVSGIAGDWAVRFEDDSGSFVAVAQLRGEGDRVEGTFLTATGDYRYLAGRHDGGFLRLSTFDGAHAFLFHARARPDATLAGDFWSRDGYHATWTAEPMGERSLRDVLPDPYGEVRVVSADGKLRYRFDDLDGEPVGWDDARFRGKVVLVDIFGSWCPNCNDAAPLLAELHRTYRDRGLEVVGLAFEFTGDAERDRRVLRIYQEHHGIEFPLLLAGISDKKEAAAVLPDLSAIKSYPTAIFIARDGRVARIHSGFAGPGTGAHHDALVADFRKTIEELLAAPAPGKP